MTIDHLRCEYAANPIGLGETSPRFSWQLSADGNERGLRQSAYRIRVGTAFGLGDLWDSGRVESSATTFIPYAGEPLTSRLRAHWSVESWDGDGRSITSEPAFFEMGLQQASDWTAEWIGASWVGGPHTESPPPYVRKAFSLPGKKIRSARLYATALGLYEARINGRRVGDDVFAPGWTDYRQRVQYQAYDVTSLLSAGDNVIAAIVGDGWYCGYTGNIDLRQFYGDRPKVLVQLVVIFEDGTQTAVVSDASWSVAHGPILASDFMMGEIYDARLEMPGWDTAEFRPAEAAWHPAAVFADPGIARVAMTGPAVQEVRSIKPVSIKTSQFAWNEDQSVVDFGQNLVGRVRLRVKGPAGSSARMTFVEVLDAGGAPYTANLRTARQTDVYTLRGDPGGETYESRFTFHGFRYVSIRGYAGTLTSDDIEAVVLHSQMQQTGTFECSDPLVNQLQSNIEWGQRGNFVDVPTDCPQRNERLGWTGDAQVFVRTAAFNFDVSGFFAKWTLDLRDAQSPQGGYPKYAPLNMNIRPVSGQDFEAEADGGPAWADAGLICPWTMWQVYGDTRHIERHYESMRRFVDRMIVAARPFGLIRSHPNWKGWHGYGDWLSQDGKDGLFGSTPQDLIGTAFLAHDCRLMAQMARATGKDGAEHYEAVAEEVATAFRNRYLTPAGLVFSNTQTACLLALHFDLVPPALRAKTLEQLLHNIRVNGNRLNTGFVGSPYINLVLTAMGRSDVAYALLMQKNWPSWLYAVTQGATTIWERWDGWTKEKGFQDPGMNSFNHYAYGAVGAWLYQNVAGIDIDPQRPGYAHVLLRPGPLKDGPLKFAKAALETIRGRVESGWTVERSRLVYDALLPPNVTATLTLPAEGDVSEAGKIVGHCKGIFVTELGSGRYRFECDLPNA